MTGERSRQILRSGSDTALSFRGRGLGSRRYRDPGGAVPQAALRSVRRAASRALRDCLSAVRHRPVRFSPAVDDAHHKVDTESEEKHHNEHAANIEES